MGESGNLEWLYVLFRFPMNQIFKPSNIAENATEKEDN